MTTPIPKPRPPSLFSPFQWFVLVLGLGLIALYVCTQVATRGEAAREDAAQHRLAQSQQRFYDALAAVANPAAFEAKCGKAAWHRSVGSAAALIYDEPMTGQPRGTETLAVIFGGDPPIGFRDTLHGKVRILQPAAALSDIHCDITK